MSFLIKKIDMTLDPTSISRAIEQVRYIEDRLHPAMMELITKFSEEGVAIARAELVSFDHPAFYTGTLYESIRSEVDEDTGRIIADCDYAMYVEYGTGDGFDDANADGVGRAGKPIHYMYGWCYFNENDGRFHRTTGMSARPFMHNTYLKLIDKITADGGRIIAEYLAD